MKEIHLTYRNKYDYTIIDIEGNIGFHDVSKIVSFIYDYELSEAYNLILNFKNKSVINISALPEFVKLSNSLHDSQKNMYFMNLSKDQKELFKTQGFYKYFNFINDEEVLMESLHKDSLDDILDID